MKFVIYWVNVKYGNNLLFKGSVYKSRNVLFKLGNI